MEERVIHWSPQLEDIIAKEAERCRGYAYLHQKAEQINTSRNNYIQIPVIILSTLSGVGSTASSSLFEGQEKIASIVIGLVSIGVGILNTIGSFFQYARRSEAHHIAYLQYSQLFSWISVELALPENEREHPEVILSELRNTMKKLKETTPSIPPEIITHFNKKFEKYTNQVAFPIETNGLSQVVVFRNPLLTSISKVDAAKEETRQPEQSILAIRTRNITHSVGNTPRGQEISEIETQ